MSDSIRTFPCVACGSKLAFQPGADSLACDKCGTTQAVPGSEESIDEYDLDAALAGANTVDPASIAENATEVRCEGCGAVSVVTGQADRCAFCDAPVVVMTDAEDMLKPESVLPFAVQKNVASEKFQSWIGSRWFAPSDLQMRAQQEAINGVYLPYFTFDSRAAARYSGERGEHYRVQETYTDGDGNERERDIRKTRWEPASGRVQRTFDDVLVCATKSLPRTLTESLEPWDLSDLKPFDPAFLAGFQAERYSIELADGWEAAQKRMERTLRDDAEDDIGGDEQKLDHIHIHHDAVTFKHTLLPLWISSYRYGDDVYRVIVNARTGSISGDRPYSKVKIALFVGTLVAFALFLCFGGSCCSSIIGVAAGD